MSRKFKLQRICWAHGDDCKGNLTKEHVVSNAILKYFGNLHFKDDGKVKKLGKGSYVIRSLCEYHNRELSVYDAEAVKFFSKWYEIMFDKEPITKLTDRKKVQIQGELLEKWYAKTFMNAVIFRAQAFENVNSPNFSSSHSIKDVIFKDGSFKPPFGIYLIKPPHSLQREFPLYSMSPQFVKCEHIKHTTNIRIPCDVPTFYYTTAFSTEIVGFFNLTIFSDEEALNGVLKPIAQELNRIGIYRKFQFGVDMPWDSAFADAQGFNRGVELLW